MIAVTRMDRQLMHLNPDHIVSIEETPDTVIFLFNGSRYIVLECAAMIINRIVAFRAKIARRAGSHPPKKYLGRTRSLHFKRAMIDGESVCPDREDEPVRTPFHSRDY